MRTHRDFLVEIGTEELPPRCVDSISLDFKNQLGEQLALKGLSFKSMTPFSTPRRIALLVHRLSERQSSRRIEKKGPLCKLAVDEKGLPNEVGLGFAKACRVPFEALTRMSTREGERLLHRAEQEGQLAVALLPEIILAAFQKLYLEKRMRWAGEEHSFIRPVRSITVLFGKEIIPVTYWGVSSSNMTAGHRFLNPRPLKITTPKRYEKILKTKGFVIPSFLERQSLVLKSIQKQTEEGSEKVVVEETLLSEVTNLLEWPCAYRCHFDSRFCELPEEVLISAIEHHQRSFPVRSLQGTLLPYFITVSNIPSQRAEAIVAGNERVMRARLADADFFFKEDLKEPLANRVDALKEVSFQEALGSMFDKTLRVRELCQYLAKQVNEKMPEVCRAAFLSKADLLTQMVNEFPELQGIMGGIYAKANGESDPVALAIREQYLPRFAGDKLPTSQEGACLAIADRIDSLVGFFGIGKIPTADKDPFGLRRAALGVLRIMIERAVDVDLKALIIFAHSLYKMHKGEPEVLFQFMMERLKFLSDEKGILPTVFNAVMAKEPTRPLDWQRRVEAVTVFIHLEEAEALIAANKRVSNILKKEAKLCGEAGEVRPALLKLPAEIMLAEKLKETRKEIARYYEKNAYTEAFKGLANLRREVDRFFDTVLVMAEQTELRNNRLALLGELRAVFSEVADISLL
ncbi:MAG: glycine--tRNA ligase subunit beta [Gammaproteobacteria bacterium]|nr:glycine--tRNA ligase subunit beta [Gammaproteobacteria bacterium]